MASEGEVSLRVRLLPQVAGGAGGVAPARGAAPPGAAGEGAGGVSELGQAARALREAARGLAAGGGGGGVGALGVAAGTALGGIAGGAALAALNQIGSLLGALATTLLPNVLGQLDKISAQGERAAVAQVGGVVGGLARLGVQVPEAQQLQLFEQSRFAENQALAAQRKLEALAGIPTMTEAIQGIQGLPGAAIADAGHIMGETVAKQARQFFGTFTAG